MEHLKTNCVHIKCIYNGLHEQNFTEIDINVPDSEKLSTFYNNDSGCENWKIYGSSRPKICEANSRVCSNVKICHTLMCDKYHFVQNLKLVCLSRPNPKHFAGAAVCRAEELKKNVST